MFNMMMKGMKGMGKTGLRNFENQKKVHISGLPANSVSRDTNMKLKAPQAASGSLVSMFKVFWGCYCTF